MHNSASFKRTRALSFAVPLNFQKSPFTCICKRALCHVHNSAPLPYDGALSFAAPFNMQQSPVNCSAFQFATESFYWHANELIARVFQHVSHHERYADTGWGRSIGCLKLQVIFRKRATNYRTIKLYVSFAEYCLFYMALLQKRPIILLILLTKATAYLANRTRTGQRNTVYVIHFILQNTVDVIYFTLQKICYINCITLAINVI